MTLLSYVIPKFAFRLPPNRPVYRRADQVPSQSAVLITGASSGIGADCALYLCQQGYMVFAGVRKSEDGERLVQMARQFNKSSQTFQGRIVPITLDVEKQDTVTKALKSIESTSKDMNAQLVAVYCNAGITHAVPFELESVDKVKEMFDVNVFGMVRVVQTFLPLLRQSNSPRVVITGSLNGTAANYAMATYSATKGALELYSDAMRQELNQSGVAVVLIKPGAVHTPIFDKSTGKSQKYLTGMTEQQKKIATELYPDIVEAVNQNLIAAIANRGVQPRFISLAVRDAIESPVPATRYNVGPDAVGAVLLKQVLQLMGSIGDYAFDFILMAILKANLKVGKLPFVAKKSQ